MDVELPAAVTDTEIIELRVDLATREFYSIDEYEGGTELVHVQAEADVAIRALVSQQDIANLSEHLILDSDVDPGWAQIRFDRRILVEFDAVIDLGAETAELQYAGATQIQP